MDAEPRIKEIMERAKADAMLSGIHADDRNTINAFSVHFLAAWVERLEFDMNQFSAPAEELDLPAFLRKQAD